MPSGTPIASPCPVEPQGQAAADEAAPGGKSSRTDSAVARLEGETTFKLFHLKAMKELHAANQR